MSGAYTATLPVRQETVLYLSGRLQAERTRRGTRTGTRALSCFKQAVLILRWLLDGTRMKQLACENRIGKSTGYDYLHEGIDVLAAQAPGLHGALLAAKAAGYSHVNIDGALIETDRVRTPAPPTGWTCGGRASTHRHGGNVQVITAADGWPAWTSEVRPGREHDTTALSAHAEILPTLTAVERPRRGGGCGARSGPASTASSPVGAALWAVGLDLDHQVPARSGHGGRGRLGRAASRPRSVVRIQLEVDRLGVLLVPGRGGCGMIINCVRPAAGSFL